MEEARLELKVGALALGAVVVAAAILFAIGGFSTARAFTLHADFGYAGGLPAGAQVKIAGVKVGRVREVEFRPTARDERGRRVPVRLVLDVDADAAAALTVGTTAAVGQQGALGESFVELLPGDDTAPLTHGATVRGLDPPRLDVFLARVFDVFEGAANGEAFRRFLLSVADLAETGVDVVNENRPLFTNMFAELAATVHDARLAVVDARTALRTGARLLDDPKLQQTLDDLSATAKDGPVLVAEMRALVTRLDRTTAAVGPDDVAKAKATLASLETTAQRAQRIAADVERLLAKIEKGEGTLGGFVKDPQVYEDLRALLADLKANPWKFLWK